MHFRNDLESDPALCSSTASEMTASKNGVLERQPVPVAEHIHIRRRFDFEG